MFHNVVEKFYQMSIFHVHIHWRVLYLRSMKQIPFPMADEYLAQLLLGGASLFIHLKKKYLKQLCCSLCILKTQA